MFTVGAAVAGLGAHGFATRNDPAYIYQRMAPLVDRTTPAKGRENALLGLKTDIKQAVGISKDPRSLCEWETKKVAVLRNKGDEAKAEKELEVASFEKYENCTTGSQILGYFTQNWWAAVGALFAAIGVARFLGSGRKDQI